MSKLTVYTDGASSGNPGPGWAMYVINDLKKRVRLPFCTNNEAEYKAVIYALTELVENPALYQSADEIEFLIDSNLVVQQLNGFYKVKHPAIRGYVSEINLLLPQLPKKVVFRYIPREKNLADKLKYD